MTYKEIANDLLTRGDSKEIAAVFRLRDEATAAMVRQCCLADQPEDDEVSLWLSRLPANGIFLKDSLLRTNQQIVLKR